ncbi:MAG: AAA family ATPase [Clostridia bacterium]|nr:AAA family ATPase [Clostridia bacterium]
MNDNYELNLYIDEMDGQEAAIPAQTTEPVSQVKPSQTGLISFDGVNAMPPKYLWAPYLRAENLNILRGDGGAGKTMLALAVIAAVTKGELSSGMPGVLHCEPSTAIYYGAEDDAEDYRYRLDLCGCDASRVFTVPAGQMPTFDHPELIARQIREVNAKLVVFDPVQSFLPAHVDMNSAADVRPLLEGLRRMCRETGCTVILIEHLNKAAKMKAAYRGIGTVDFINAARSALLVGYHPSDPNMRACVHVKANARMGQAIQFSIDSSGRFRWEGTCDVTAEDVADARPKLTQACQQAVDPVFFMARHLLEQHPDGWKGTASEMIAECSALPYGQTITSPKSLGKLLDHSVSLAAGGIGYSKNARREYSFFFLNGDA